MEPVAVLMEANMDQLRCAIYPLFQRQKETHMITVLHENSETACPHADVDGDDVWIGGGDLTAITGWTLKPEGFCREEVCVPVPPARAARFVSGGRVNLSAFWTHLGNAVARDEQGTVWSLGANAHERASALRSLHAPDFSLPDLAGTLHSLAAQRGKKVLLVTWASW